MTNAVERLRGCRKDLAHSQREALTSRTLLITGGPGVDQTTLVNAILLILRAKKVRCALCAPTGHATKRLSETTGVEAKTIHPLLKVAAEGRLSVRASLRRGSPSALRVHDPQAAPDLLFVWEQEVFALLPAEGNIPARSGSVLS